MGQIAWKWVLEEGKPPAVDVGGKIFTLRKFKSADVSAFYQTLDEASEEFAVLKYLLSKYRLAEMRLGNVASDIGAFFEPMGLGRALMVDQDSLASLIEQAMEKLKAHAEDAKHG